VHKQGGKVGPAHHDMDPEGRDQAHCGHQRVAELAIPPGPVHAAAAGAARTSAGP